ncbi:hypothetical protein PSTT_03946 [Puccinia striiformis]|uniref:CRAL-TRIO domain-containing protein n=1 Tax=Puccinia striiformis TaxID=27350 RepID=A0A2S4VUJ2_9BASI|nr:hypothetical protein PSTT_03946 [Puccinia striiformis]
MNKNLTQIAIETVPPWPTPSSKQDNQRTLPFFWRTLKHPSPDSSPLPLPNDPPESLTNQQTSTYEFIVTLNSPDFELPTPALPTSHHTTVQEDPPEGSSSHSTKKLTEAEKCYCSREAILRVCRATKWDQNRALKRLVDTLVWRREFQVDQIDYRELSHEAETGKHFTLGYDNHQRPILYLFPYRQNTKPSIDQIKLLVWYLERTIDLMPPGVETLTLIIDFGDAEKSRNSSSQPTSISVAKEVLKILQTYYCERLAQAICINVPWVFWGFLKILRPFMDPKTAEKVVFDPVVTDHVPAEQLMKDCFHGELDFEYDHEVYFKLFAELTAHRRKKMLSRYCRHGKGVIGMGEFELRGGNRRERSVGSISTAISSPKPGSITSSAIVFAERITRTLEDRPCQGSSSVRFLPDKTAPKAEINSVRSTRPPLVDSTNTSKTCRSSIPQGFEYPQDVQVFGTEQRIASRPLSPNSLSQFFQPSTVKDPRGLTNQDTTEPMRTPLDPLDTVLQLYSPTTEDHSFRTPFRSPTRNDTPFLIPQFRSLNAFSLDERGLLQADNMSCSRRSVELFMTFFTCTFNRC